MGEQISNLKDSAPGLGLSIIVSDCGLYINRVNTGEERSMNKICMNMTSESS